MSEDNNIPSKTYPIPKILRYTGFAILLLMLVLSLIYQMSNPNATEEERIEATVQAGVNQGLTEVMIQTGTPDPTAIQATVEARIEATLTAAPDSTTVDDDTNSDNDNTMPEFINLILSPFRAMWNFAGLGGIWIQIICCLAPVLLIVIGIAND